MSKPSPAATPQLATSATAPDPLQAAVDAWCIDHFGVATPQFGNFPAAKEDLVPRIRAALTKEMSNA